MVLLVEKFGCIVGFNDYVMGLVVVAAGTSVPVCNVRIVYCIQIVFVHCICTLYLYIAFVDWICICLYCQYLICLYVIKYAICGEEAQICFDF